MKVIDPTVDFDNLEALRVIIAVFIAIALATAKNGRHGLCRTFAKILWVQNKLFDNTTAFHRLSDCDAFSVGQVVKASSVNL
jgi:hypothetical protein